MFKFQFTQIQKRNEQMVRILYVHIKIPKLCQTIKRAQKFDRIVKFIYFSSVAINVSVLFKNSNGYSNNSFIHSFLSCYKWDFYSIEMVEWQTNVRNVYFVWIVYATLWYRQQHSTRNYFLPLFTYSTNTYILFSRPTFYLHIVNNTVN